MKGEDNYNPISGGVSEEIMDNDWSIKGENKREYWHGLCSLYFLPEQFRVTLLAQIRAACKRHQLAKPLNRKV